MNCENCGAPMTLIRDRDFFVCEYCGAFHFPTESPDGVRVLGSLDEAIDCPVCHTPLVLASIDEQKILHCPRCQGVLSAQPTFVRIIDYRRARLEKSATPPRPLDPRDLQRRIDCPRCGLPMDVHPYYGPGNIVIDTCYRCAVVWLDFGELGKIYRAPGW